MAKNKIRFGVGGPDQPYSGLWRLIVSGNDVYVGASGNSMGIFKISLHESGVWTLAATKQSGAKFDNDNRRAKRWERPMQHSKGVTRGPSVIVPYTSLESRPISEKEKRKKAYWFEAPYLGEIVEYSIYFVDKGTSTNWTKETEVAKFKTSDENFVVLLACKKLAPLDFLATCEKLLRENKFGMEKPESLEEGSFLWITESKDELSVPLFIDLPVPIKGRNE